MDDRYISFQGQDGKEAEAFVQSVRRAAFDASKDRDDEWMARFASMSMSGKALRWYESLDDDVQDSWKRLRKAILTQYPPPDEDSIVPSPATWASPVAPAAAPPSGTPQPSSFSQIDYPSSAAAPPPPPQQRGKPFDGYSGFIEIRFAQASRVMGQISQTLKDNGTVQVTPNGESSGQKMTVKNEPNSNQSQLAVNAGPGSPNNFLGLTWLHLKGARASAGYCYAAAVFTQESNGSGSSITAPYYEGGSEATVWGIAPDGAVSAMVDGKDLAFYVYKETNQINLFPDFEAYVAARGVATEWEKVDLIFKPE